MVYKGQNEKLFWSRKYHLHICVQPLTDVHVNQQTSLIQEQQTSITVTLRQTFASSTDMKYGLEMTTRGVCNILNSRQEEINAKNDVKFNSTQVIGIYMNLNVHMHVIILSEDRRRLLFTCFHYLVIPYPVLTIMSMRYSTEIWAETRTRVNHSNPFTVTNKQLQLQTTNLSVNNVRHMWWFFYTIILINKYAFQYNAYRLLRWPLWTEWLTDRCKNITLHQT